MEFETFKNIQSEIVGLIPAGGKGTRIAPLPCSKEIFPVGFLSMDQGSSFRPKVACQYLLEKMRLAGAIKAYIILRKGKWDIPGYFGDGKMLDMNLAYLIMDLPFGVPYTLDQGYSFLQDATVVFGFPDILFQPEDAFVQLLAKQAESNADIVLGLYSAHQSQSHKMDMVELDTDGRVYGIEIKPIRTKLRFTWIIAVWNSIFTHFMHNYVSHISKKTEEIKTRNSGIELHEVFLGDVIREAIHNRLKIDHILFTDGKYLDIGTPEDMVRAVQFSTI